MGQTDIRAAVGTIAAFAAAQDIYKSAPSSTREVAGVLANAWWVRQLSGNVVTVAIGHSTRQFVKLIDGTYQTLGAGAPATLAVTGTRAPYEERCLELCLPNIRIFRRRASIMHIVACMVDFQNFDHNRATNFVASPASLDIDCE